MKQKLVTSLLFGSALVGMGLGLAATRLTPTAQAAPVTPLTAAGPLNAAGPVAEMMAGKTYPLTLKAEQLDSTYHLVSLVDPQGHVSQYATRGETVGAGGETFLVCYDVTVTNSSTRPPQPKAGATGQLIYINLHAVEAIGGIIPIQPASAGAAAAALP